ncbi:MAG TPA: PQQ-dependent sugar dehydrogenase [Fibrobacteria bacterium]|nr:PQQ-dependent sugar dehydrogenase [Fibrobacteria bacterium]
MALLSGAFLPAGAQSQTIPDNVTFRNHFGDMRFNRPLQLAEYPGEDSVYVVVQQSGRLVTVQHQNGNWVKTDSADIAVLGGTSGGNEQGLLGFAFHPDFRENRRYYVNYMTGSGSGAHLVAERTAGEALRPRTDDAQRTILRMTDFAGNHNGGSIGFGPDGKFYVGFGDGGNANDAGNLAQNLDTLFGKILRLDVDGPDAYPDDDTRNYAIPDDNPFVGQAGRRGEIWAYGLRNPYRWSFHPLTGDIWIGDVGQNRWEEISRVHTGGLNLGWRIREGAFCFNPATGCTDEGLTPPARTIQRAHGASITGGTVFTGDPNSAYHGIYIFGDYVTNHVWAMRPQGALLADSVVIGQVFNVSSFDRDARGRVFATSLSNSSSVGSNNGVVFILESPDMQPGPTAVRSGRRPRDGPPLRLSALRRNPAAYEWRGLDGGLLPTPTATFRGVAWVRAKNGTQPARLVTLF